MREDGVRRRDHCLHRPSLQEREFFIDHLLVRNHFIIVPTQSHISPSGLHRASLQKKERGTERRQPARLTINGSRGNEQLLRRNVKRFRGGLVFEGHRLCVSLDSRLGSNKEEEEVDTCRSCAESSDADLWSISVAPYGNTYNL